MNDKQQMTNLSSKDLQIFIDQHKLPATIIHLKEDTPTVPDAARVLGVEMEKILKSLVFLVKDDPILVIASGTARIDPRPLAAHFGIGRKWIKFASPEQALHITGYIVGSMPPFGHKATLETFIDADVTSLETIYAGGGDVHALMQLDVTQLLAVTGGRVLSLTKTI